MKTCMRCGDSFLVRDAKSRFLEDLQYLGREDDIDWFDSDLCGSCNVDLYLERNDVSVGGDYRTYEEYLESGGPVDPSQDCLWLHDQE